MKLLRATTRLAMLSTITAVLSFSLVAGKLVLLKTTHARLLWRNWHFRAWARVVVRLLNIRINPTTFTPSKPFLLVANHLSYIDIVVLAAKLDCTFIAKSDVAHWPIIGWLSKVTDTIFINRRQHRDLNRAMHSAQRFIEQGLGVVLFAEGTSTSGKEVAPFKSSMLEFAAQKSVPVCYASLSYATSPNEASAAETICWWGDMTFPDHFFRLLQLSGFEATLNFGRDPIVANDRRVLANRLWQAVNAQFIPVSAH